MVPWVDIILVFERDRDRDREFACVSFKDVVRSGLRVHQWYPSTCKTTANKQTFGSVDSDPHPGSWETTQENNPGSTAPLALDSSPTLAFLTHQKQKPVANELVATMWQ